MKYQIQYATIQGDTKIHEVEASSEVSAMLSLPPHIQVDWIKKVESIDAFLKRPIK